MFAVLLFVGLSLAAAVSPLSAQDFDDEFPPGLLARYSAGGRTIERVDPDIAFDWGEQSPDPRLAAGALQAEWESLLLIRKNAAYRFHLYLAGAVELTLNDETVLQAETDAPGWVSSEPVELKFGESEFRLKYRASGPRGLVKLFWSSDDFPLEPVPREQFFREEAHAASREYAAGVRTLVANRCFACHESELELPTIAAPALDRAATGLDAAWIVAKLTEPEQADPQGRMPRFMFTRDEAAAVAAYLLDRSETVELKPVPKSKDARADRAVGEKLVHSLGCLACHQMGESGHADVFAGPSLSLIASKRSLEWLYGWLQDPARLNRDHRMPVYEWKKDELRQVALYLGSLGRRPQADGDRSDGGLVDRGRELITAARCANCHRIPGIEASREGIPPIKEVTSPGSCVRGEGRLHGKQPAFSAERVAASSIDGFVAATAAAPATLADFERGELLLEVKNCIQCHPRGASQGIVPVAGRVAQQLSALRGQSEAMIPPALTAVGDKLKDEALAQAVAGKQPRRMDWLLIRMPQFRHSDDEQRALQTYLTAHDRLPEGVPDPHFLTVDETPADSQTLLLSNTLVGPKGFSCVACHQLGSYVPRNVALGTKGSDLLHLGRRMRFEYFLRWTRAPIRIVPGMEMPSIGHKPVPGILDADIDRQLAVIWKGLNSPDFTVPTDPASVEQFWVVQPDEPARIVRDVFTLPKEAGDGYLPRAFAVGLPNRHNILFDLDRFALRMWTYGDLARQRTQGKSWYWDMAGVPIASLKDDESGFLLETGGQRIAPALDQSQAGRLLEYRPAGSGILLRYQLRFDVEGETRWVAVRESWQPAAPQNGRAGWERTIQVEQAPPDARLMLRHPSAGSDDTTLRFSAAGADGMYPVGNELTVTALSALATPALPIKPLDRVVSEATPITSVPGFDGVRLPLDGGIMPTALSWNRAGEFVFTSLKGDVFRALDTDGDGLEDRLSLFEEGLAAPYGIIADGDSLIVSHKPELVRLRDTDGDGRADERTVFSSGWGYTDNYHDWTCGIVRDDGGNLYVGLGSDYAQPKRPRERARWRGTILRILPDGTPQQIASAFRYPTGLAFDNHGRLFATDNQGVQNTFNELNHIRDGQHYGVPGRYEEEHETPASPPAIQIPHPWSRSINGITFIPEGIPGLEAFAGHGLGCEYDSRFLIRFTLQEVDGVMQGATYYFSRPIEQAVPENFVGPLSIAVRPDGRIFVGSIHDSGWLGGRNTGAIARLTPRKELPNGIRELTATAEGFRLEFFHSVDAEKAGDVGRYQISAYTRKWSGSYATPDSDRHRVDVMAAKVSADGRTVDLKTGERETGFVYEVNCRDIGAGEDAVLWPDTGHYTLHRIP